LIYRTNVFIYDTKVGQDGVFPADLLVVSGVAGFEEKLVQEQGGADQASL